MIIYTTCRDCGGLLHTTNGDTSHPDCNPQPTKLETVLHEWTISIAIGDDTATAALQTEMNELEARPPRLLDSALYYATMYGWPVFPLQPQSKAPATTTGFKAASTNPHQIKTWWEYNPHYNIGLPTGHAFDVIDIDHPDGMPIYRKLLTENGEIHGLVGTPSLGLHLYIRPSAKERGNHTRWKPGTDYRGKGGYVVAPPSTTDHGAWTWRYRPSPIITGIGNTYGRK